MDPPMSVHPNVKAAFAVGVIFLGALLCCLVWFYALAWALNSVGLLWRLAVDDRDAWTLAGLIVVVLAVCGFLSRRRRS
jgi:hypothetical protein